MFPASYPDVIAHHITLQFPFNHDDLPENFKNYPVNFEVIGYNKNDKVDCVVVSPHEYDILLISKLQTPEKILHVTLSVKRENGEKPVMSNSLLKEHGYTEMIFKLNIAGHIQVLE